MTEKALFDVIPPDAFNEDDTPPTREDWAWYNAILAETTRAMTWWMCSLERNARRRYKRFSRAQQAVMWEYCQDIADLIGDGVTQRYVHRQLVWFTRRALITYRDGDIPAPRRRYQPYELRNIINAAMHGKYPAIAAS